MIYNKYIRYIKMRLFYRMKHLQRLSDQELLGLMRHEAHRVEKSVYNNILDKKRAYYDQKYQLINQITSILLKRDTKYADHPSIIWAGKINLAYPDIEKNFVNTYSSESGVNDDFIKINPEDYFFTRRSCRVWSKQQPSKEELEAVSERLISIGIHAPNSGNRQPWKFAVLIDKDEKEVLKGLKERHCYSAPLLIFVGVDKRLYKPAEHLENCLYIDAAAAATQMIIAAHMLGYGTCWNHLGEDLINSRTMNKESYAKLCRLKNIEHYVTPVAIIAIGMPEFIPPEPSRVNLDDVLLK
ncbi:MAG: hypothetical protein C0593_03440 [Marinilabiliales bacterium]|nr:MAG: hypothetical protein C0593_03440 [Marinilabiliales bacterium]